MPFSTTRIKTYCHVSTELAALSDSKLVELLTKAKPMHVGIGGRSALLGIDGTNVFVKKICLSDLERQPENVMSTANLFDLPLFYQYGIGSAGFGAWRELLAHIMTTNWVISGECPNFPIMYHWRILPNDPTDLHVGHWGDLDSYAKYWEDSPAIRRRAEAIHNASAHIVLFLEYIPQNLHQWLGEQLSEGGKKAEWAVDFALENLKLTNDFINAHGLLHFDAHFANILTDGKRLYFSDFGLALSSKFELTKLESDFLKMHKNYDHCSTAVNLLHCIITSLFGEEQWVLRLREYLNGELGELPPSIASIIKQYASIAFAMDVFYSKLQKEDKSTPYPVDELERFTVQ